MANANHLRRACGRAALAGLLGAVIVIGWAGQGARAEDDEEVLPDVKIMQHILKGLGLSRGDDGIDYRERPPLVLPATRDLPPPEAEASANKTAGWPDDPDVKRARRIKLEERKRHAHVEGVDDRPLRPDEMSKAPPPGQDDGQPRKTANESAKPMSPAELGSKSVFSWSNLWGSNEDYSTFTREPPRTNLIEPPAGYRTPSPNQPYGVGKEKWTAKPTDRQEYAK
jgi:hypothetical protein